METAVTLTDKIPLGFMTAYQPIAKELGPAAKVCELGVALGGSLELWKYLFPDGTIAGVDIDPDSGWSEDTIKIVCDQSDSELPSILSNYSRKWDLIIDDASHVAYLTASSLDNLWPLVRPGGYYVIENTDLNRGMADFAASLINIDRFSLCSNVEMVSYFIGLVVLKKRNTMKPVN